MDNITVYEHTNALRFWTEWYKLTGNTSGLRQLHTYQGKPATNHAGSVLLSALK